MNRAIPFHNDSVLLWLAIILFGLIAGRSARGQDDVDALLSPEPPPHPRLLFLKEDEAKVAEKLAGDPSLGKANQLVQEVAERLLSEPVLERELEGRRLLGVSRECLERVLQLAFTYRMTDDERFLRRAEQELLATARFEDWNPSHFLDVAEMTAALAIGYDWLYNDLAPEVRNEIRTAIIEKGLRESIPGGSWIRTENNWNQVCHGGMVLGALAIWEDERELADQIVRRAIEHVPIAMSEYSPDGAYPEGPSYWEYGTTFNVILIATLKSALGSDFGLSEFPGFLESSTYYAQVRGPTGLYFNYSDCGLSKGVTAAQFWFASHRDDTSLLWHEWKLFDDMMSQDNERRRSGGRFFPLLLLWAGPRADTVPPTMTSWKADGRTPVAIHRSGWSSADDVFVAIKGGSPKTNHAHMDIGSFVMDADGVRWAEDLGAQSYHSLESRGISLWGKNQDSQRWEVFRLGTYSHNTLVVNGQQQRVDGDAPLNKHSSEGPMPHTIVDLTSVYDGQLAVVERGIGLRSDRSVVIQDELITLEQPTTVRWGMVTRAEVEIQANAAATLRRDGKTLTLRVLEPNDVQLKTFDTANPPRDYDVANEGTRMIGFEAEFAPQSMQRMVVELRPESATGQETAEIVSLSDW